MLELFLGDGLFMKDLIGILDVGLGGFNVFSTLAATFPKERFIYQNNLKYYPYSGRPEAEIKQLVAADIDGILQENPAVLIVVADSIIEYDDEKLESINIPIIRIDDVIIDYVNQNYEQKNMVLLARKDIIDANIYQKRFIYNHLYNIPSNDLERIIESKMTKTAQSFAAVFDAFRGVIKKDIDIIITGSPYLANLRTEIREFINFQMITDIGMIIANKLNEFLAEGKEKRRGERIVKTNVSAKVFREKAYWADLKYKIREY